MFMKKWCCVAVALFLLFPASAFGQDEGGDDAPAAEETASVSDSSSSSSGEFIYEQGGMSGLGLVFGLKLGGGFGQVSSDLGTTFVGELEFGYLLPYLDRSFELFITGQYAAPTTEGSGEADARLPGDGVMTYEIVQRQAIITYGFIYRLPLSLPLFRPYVALGGRTYLHRTEATAKAGGMEYGANEETATDWGFYSALGGELHFGPAGSVLMEVQFGYAALDGYIMRDTNVGSLNVALGYRFFL